MGRHYDREDRRKKKRRRSIIKCSQLADIARNHTPLHCSSKGGGITKVGAGWPTATYQIGDKKDWHISFMFTV